MDDLLPNDTYFAPEVPEDQKQEDNAERAKVQKGMEMLEEVISHFAERIAFYDSIDSVKSDIETSPEVHLRNVIANQLTKENLVTEKDWLEGLREQYK